MPRKKIISLKNWDKYQARTDKDLPWAKLWGGLFDRPWFQKMKDKDKIVPIIFIDLARKNGNRIGEESIFNGYLSRNYNLLHTDNELFIICKYLSDNEFLSDNVSDIEDKRRQEKTREESPAQNAAPLKPIDESKQIDLKDINLKGQSEGIKHKVFNDLVDTFRARGWKDEPEYVKTIFKQICVEMDGYEPKELFPYFARVAKNFINKNSELFSADAKIVRGQERKLGLTPIGMVTV